MAEFKIKLSNGKYSRIIEASESRHAYRILLDKYGKYDNPKIELIGIPTTNYICRQHHKWGIEKTTKDKVVVARISQLNSLVNSIDNVMVYNDSKKLINKPNKYSYVEQAVSPQNMLISKFEILIFVAIVILIILIMVLIVK